MTNRTRYADVPAGGVTPDDVRDHATNPLRLVTGSRVRLRVTPRGEQLARRRATTLVVTKAWISDNGSDVSWVRVALAPLEDWESGAARAATYAPTCIDADSSRLQRVPSLDPSDLTEGQVRSLLSEARIYGDAMLAVDCLAWLAADVRRLVHPEATRIRDAIVAAAGDPS